MHLIGQIKGLREQVRRQMRGRARSRCRHDVAVFAVRVSLSSNPPPLPRRLPASRHSGERAAASHQVVGPGQAACHHAADDRCVRGCLAAAVVVRGREGAGRHCELTITAVRLLPHLHFAHPPPPHSAAGVMSPEIAAALGGGLHPHSLGIAAHPSSSAGAGASRARPSTTRGTLTGTTSAGAGGAGGLPPPSAGSLRRAHTAGAPALASIGA